jgi:hypothetical protein
MKYKSQNTIHDNYHVYMFRYRHLESTNTKHHKFNTCDLKEMRGQNLYVVHMLCFQILLINSRLFVIDT